MAGLLAPAFSLGSLLAINGELRLWVNAEEVSGGNGAEPRTGYLCLEAEGSPVQFKNVRIREIGL